MQAPTLNARTQGKHGAYNAIDYDNEPDPYFYAPEDGRITVVDTVDDDTCGKRLKMVGATGEHGFCHLESFNVAQGAHVVRGQKLGKMGYTGLTDPDNVPEGAHLHWVIYRNGQWVYPPDYVNETFKKEQQEEEMPNSGDAENYIKGMKGDPNYKPTQAEINEAMKLTFKQMMYNLGFPNEGDAKNYANAYGGSWEQALRMSHKGWAYKGAGSQGEAKPLAPGKYIVN